ncbi:MAG: 4Fe-4S binding protein [Clostridia bacterium]|nr:4Fe-4S binding protein [Clostridia bacterium]
MKTVLKTKLPELFEKLANNYTVFVPAKIEGISRFAPYQNGLELALEENVLMPPKDIFFPQTEKMYKFKAKDQYLEIEDLPPEEGQQVIFGVRSCDLKSIDCLDQVFLTKGFVDAFYQDKRDRSILIGLSCVKPMENCFCSSMGVDPQKGVGADIQAYDLGDKVGFEAITEKGRELLGKIETLLVEEAASVPAVEKFVLTADIEGVPEKLKNMFDHPIWDDICRKCLNCSVCAFVCPTCHCFDIASEVRGEDGTKIRCWDTCMFDEYTRMAGGHQPRPGKKERVRNRFMHKLRYFPERYDMLLCTGCGRCVAKCPVNLDITAVIRKIKEAE